MMTPDELSRRMVDVALGQASAAEEAELRRWLQEDPGRLREWQEVEATVGFLRQAPHIEPSPAFRAGLQRRLRAVEGEEGAELAGWREEVWFRVLLLGYRLRTARHLRWQLAAALLTLAAGLWLSSADPARTALAPDGVSGANQPLGVAVRRPAEPAPDSWSQPLLEDPEELLGPSREHDLDGEFLPEERGRARRGTGPALSPLPVAELQPSRRLRGGAAPGDPATAGAGAASGTWRPRQRARAWLCRQQRPDGSWTPGDGSPDLGAGVTALAVLALLTADDEQRGVLEGEAAAGPGEALRAGVAALLRVQGRDGCYGRSADPGATLFNHATSCLALLRVRQQQPALLEVNDHQRLQHGVDYLEIMLCQLFHTRDINRPCDGQNAAWASLALAAAKRGGLALGATTLSQVDAVLARLRNEQRQPALVHAAQQQILALREGPAIEFLDADWAEVVTPLLAQPGRTEPSLRYLVAAALAPAEAAVSRSGPRHRLWNSFAAELEDGLRRRQRRPSGVFPARLRWFCFDGGDVYETALAVLALDLAARR